ncbi:hypothetical protein Pyrfu_1332 [Pyrolobus fumarii 1A]|uniref:Uncharacterized protein n=1 Tax=Pyrolobus fumarii (strain DSM 11204 / 1A) TaxID=694429 RepID=G0EGP2_PYRF1|nr:hypothetical protein Pyrfu_1332 [Pyrolobus fumarii 1A]
MVRGVGIDDILEPGYKIVLADDEYVDIYEEYLFRGFDVMNADVNENKADLVGIYSIASFVGDDPAVIVCGSNSVLCAGIAASILVYKGWSAQEAIEKAEHATASLYGVGRITRQLRAAIEALGGLLKAAKNRDIVSVLLGAGEMYGYGKGRLHYGEFLSWLYIVEQEWTVLLAGALHFLTEGADEPRKLLDMRLQAIGKELAYAIDETQLTEAIDILRDYAMEDVKRREARILRLVESLEPGMPYVSFIDTMSDKLVVVCRCGEYNEPLKECVNAANKASKYLDATRFNELRIALDCTGKVKSRIEHV